MDNRSLFLVVAATFGVAPRASGWQLVQLAGLLAVVGAEPTWLPLGGVVAGCAAYTAGAYCAQTRRAKLGAACGVWAAAAFSYLFSLLHDGVGGTSATSLSYLASLVLHTVHGGVALAGW